MFFRSFIFLFGFGFSVISLSFIFIYLNLLTIGYNFFEYVQFIIRRIECLNLIIGISLIALSLSNGGKNELCF
jgi:hypothetical protein